MAKWQLFPMTALLLGAAEPTSSTHLKTDTMPAAVTHGLGLEQRLTADVTITPLAVVEDSRCPVNVLCVQAGQLVVTARIDHPGGSTTQTLVLGATTLAASGTILFAEAEERRVSDDPGEAAKWFRFTYAPNIAT